MKNSETKRNQRASEIDYLLALRQNVNFRIRALRLSNGVVSPREYRAEVSVRPNEMMSLDVGVDHCILNTGIRGIPETRDRLFGVEYPFFLERIIVPDDVASYFVISGCFMGARALWVSDTVSANYFRESSEVRFTENNYINGGLRISFSVKNKSTETRVFQVRLIGTEVRLLEEEEED